MPPKTKKPPRNSPEGLHRYVIDMGYVAVLPIKLACGTSCPITAFAADQGVVDLFSQVIEDMGHCLCHWKLKRPGNPPECRAMLLTEFWRICHFASFQADSLIYSTVQLSKRISQSPSSELDVKPVFNQIPPLKTFG